MQLFDLFKKNAAATSTSQSTKAAIMYPTAKQMRLANIAGEPPLDFIKGHPSNYLVNKYINKCSERNKEFNNSNTKLATGSKSLRNPRFFNSFLKAQI